MQPDTATASTALPSTSVIKYPSPPNDASPTPPSLPEEDLSHDELAERFRQFELGSLKHRFFGSSSGFMLMKNAILVKVSQSDQFLAASESLSRKTTWADP